MDNKESIRIQFLGAAGTVTGSKYLIHALGKTILVDCGLFQGLKNLRLMNWQNLPIQINEIDVVLLTHGHLDHCGYLPCLVKNGYKNKIIATGPTLEITKVILEDSARIQEEDAARANKEGFSKHHPAVPLYNMKDVEKTLPLFSKADPDTWIIVSEGISARFQYNGHIIGASFIELNIAGKIVVFSGDIGRKNDPLLYEPQKPEYADVLLIESTYGDSIHPQDAGDKLATVIRSAFENNSTVLIPSFAVERTQLLMYLLWQLKKKNAIPNIPVYLDTPMGKKVLEIFHHNETWHKLPARDCMEMCAQITVIKDNTETIGLARQKGAKIVIAGSGMATGGRILTYFQEYLGDSNAVILLVGYQAEGTRGRSLLDGDSEIKLLGKYYPVKAGIESIEGLSAHADQLELIDWLKEIKIKPGNIFIVHGEKEASLALQRKIMEVYQWESELPVLYDIKEIEIN